MAETKIPTEQPKGPSGNHDPVKTKTLEPRRGRSPGGCGRGGGFDTVKTEITWRLPKARRWRVNECVELFLDVDWPCHTRADDVAVLRSTWQQRDCRSTLYLTICLPPPTYL